jgi:hypothetical protein
MKAVKGSSFSRLAHDGFACALSLALALAPVPGCRKQSAEPRPTTITVAEAADRAARARAALRGLEPKLATAGAAMAGLHREFDPLPPGLPGFGPTRSKFYATAEGVGMLGAKLPWLSARIDSAEKARDGAALSSLSLDIERVDAQLGRVERLAVELLHEVQPFKSVAEEPFGPPPAKCE